MSKEQANEILTQQGISKDVKFRYMLLSRMQNDCEYYLGYGSRNKKHLWALDEKEHIQIMRALYVSLPVAPEWLTIKEIDKYENLMNAV